MDVDAIARARISVRHIMREPGLARMLGAIEDIAQMVVKCTVELVRLNRLDCPVQRFPCLQHRLTTNGSTSLVRSLADCKRQCDLPAS